MSCDAHPHAGRSQRPGGAAPHCSALLHRRRARPALRTGRHQQPRRHGSARGMRGAMLCRQPWAASLPLYQAIRGRPAAACARQQRPGLASGMLEARLRQVPHAERAVVARGQQQRHSAARSRGPHLVARAGAPLTGGPHSSAPRLLACRGGLARISRHVARARLSACAVGHQLHVGDPAAVQPRAHQRPQRGLRSVPARAALRTGVHGGRQRARNRPPASKALLHSALLATFILHKNVPDMNRAHFTRSRVRAARHSIYARRASLIAWCYHQPAKRVAAEHGRPALGRGAPRSPACPTRPHGRPCRPPPAAHTVRPGCAKRPSPVSAARPRRATTATGRQASASLMGRAVGCHPGAWRMAPATQPLR